MEKMREDQRKKLRKGDASRKSERRKVELTGARSNPHSKIISSCSSAQLRGSFLLKIPPPLSSL